MLSFLLWTRTRYGGYDTALHHLLKLPGPPQHPVPFATRHAQPILVRHYANLAIAESSTDQERGSRMDPWPPGHEAFLCSDTVRQLAALEITSGSAAHHAAVLRSENTPLSVPVLLLGSLRARGDFSLLSLSLVEDTSAPKKYRWTVSDTQFFNIHKPLFPAPAAR
jgi:hypothetical protein